jgi:hypothetical protein
MINIFTIYSVYILLNISLIKHFSNRYLVFDNYLIEEFTIKQLYELLIVIIGMYKLIVEGIKIISLPIIIITLFINEVRIVESRNSDKEDKQNYVQYQNITCVICLDEITLAKWSEVIKLKCHIRYETLLLCNYNRHVFHIKCLSVWCKDNLTCPICKKNIIN